jgi:hypothetical protein
MRFDGGKRRPRPRRRRPDRQRTANPRSIPKNVTRRRSLVLELLLTEKDGAITAEIAKATDWQNHSIRGFISGTIAKKMCLAVESAKNDDGERTYRIADK